MAVYRAPRAPRHGRRRVAGPVGRQAIAEALALLYGDKPGLQGEEALAERERLREEAERAEHVQGTLRFRGDS